MGVGVGTGAANLLVVDVGVGVCVVAGESVVVVGISTGTNLTTTFWVAFISILAVLPNVANTGPIHSSIFHPGLGRTSMVTVLPDT